MKLNPFFTYRLSEVDFHESTYPRQMLLAILDEGLFCLKFTWPSEANHASTKEALPQALKGALMSVARLTMKNKKMTMGEFLNGMRNQFSGNRLRVRITFSPHD